MKFKPNLKLKACEFSFVFCSFVKIKCPQKWVSNSKVQQGKSLNSIRVSFVIFQIGPGESQPFELTVKRLESALQKAQEQVFSLDQINRG